MYIVHPIFKIFSPYFKWSLFFLHFKKFFSINYKIRKKIHFSLDTFFYESWSCLTYLNYVIVPWGVNWHSKWFFENRQNSVGAFIGQIEQKWPNKVDSEGINTNESNIKFDHVSEPVAAFTGVEISLFMTLVIDNWVFDHKNNEAKRWGHQFDHSLIQFKITFHELWNFLICSKAIQFLNWSLKLRANIRIRPIFSRLLSCSWYLSIRKNPCQSMKIEVIKPQTRTKASQTM